MHSPAVRQVIFLDFTVFFVQYAKVVRFDLYDFLA